LRCVLNLVNLLLGLLNLLNETPNVFSQVAYPLIAGVGLGMLFHAPYQVFTRALKPQELATGTSAFFLVRFTGATVGLVSFSFILAVFFTNARVKAVAGTIYYARASTHLPHDLRFQGSSSSINYSAIKSLPPDVKELVLHTISSSIGVSSFRFSKSMTRLTYVLVNMDRLCPVPGRGISGGWFELLALSYVTYDAFRYRWSSEKCQALMD